jgi:hypothetical protein
MLQVGLFVWVDKEIFAIATIPKVGLKSLT